MADASRSRTPPAWKPGHRVLRWTWISAAVLVFGGLGGFLSFVLRRPDLAAAAIATAFPFCFLALIKLWFEIGRAVEIPPETRSRLRRSLIVLGPVPVLQLLIHRYFPDSEFSGLARSRE